MILVRHVRNKKIRKLWPYNFYSGFFKKVFDIIKAREDKVTPAEKNSRQQRFVVSLYNTLENRKFT
jgi:hypothetical protein